MDISYQWLQGFLPALPEPARVAELLTACGLEVESVRTEVAVPGGLEGVVTGKILTAVKHPEADRLQICTVDTGAGAPAQIVCGAPNAAAGQTVLVALPGATLYPKVGEPFKIKKSKIRGAESHGMICADDELGIGESHEGIRVLDTEFAPGTPAASALNLQSDSIFMIGLTPNRADAASHLGVARDLAVLTQQTLQWPDRDTLEIAVTPAQYSVYIDAPEACGIYRLQKIEGLHNGPSPDALQQKLKAAGLNVLSHIVDITNYMLMGYGQPMHAFDADKVQGDIRVRYAQAGETMVTLAGDALTLKADDLIIADASGPIALAGVIGGKATSVDADTRNILLETAWFHPDAVRRTSRNHQIHTDASFRFARGTDPASVARYARIAVQLYLSQFPAKGACAAAIATGVLPQPAEISFSLADFHRLAGIQITAQEVERILRGLEMEVSTDAGMWKIIVPAYRVDVLRPQDVYEDILRIYGYDQVPVSGRMPAAPVFPLADAEFALRDSIATQLSAKGFYEILTNSLVPAAAVGAQGVVMKNPLSEEHAALRSRMLPSGLEVIAHNRNRRQQDLRFFEFGKTYATSENGYTETLKLCIWFAGDRRPLHWKEKGAAADIFTMSSIAEWIIGSMGTSIQMEAYEDTDFDFGNALMQGKQQLGRYGKVSSDLCAQYDVSIPVYYLEMDWKAIFKTAGKRMPVYQELPKFPAVRRDLSLLVPSGLRWMDMQRVILKSDPSLVRQAELFDVFTSPEGKRSYSVAITLQDPSNTLQDARIEKCMEKITLQLSETCGATVKV